MDVFIERANLLLKQGRVNDAITQVKSLLQQNPENEEALAMYTRCLFEKKDFDEGIKTITQALALNADNHYYYYLLAFGYYRKNNNKIAIEKLNESIQLNPFFCEAFGLLSHIYCEDRNFEMALQKANEGLEIDPENISCLNGRSVALNKLKRTDAAIETMQMALSQDPDNEYTHATVGWNYLEKGKNKIAANHFKETLRINPNNLNAQKGLKEALKSTIPPYRWLLQYSFWINNKGKKARWMFPLGLFFAVKLSSAAFEYKEGTQLIGVTIIGIYIFFVLITWLINPLANFFLLFNKEGKHAINDTEKYTSISVVVSLLMGTLFFAFGYAFFSKLIPQSFLVAAIAFWAMAIPLSNLQYPLSFKTYSLKNKVALVLVALAILTSILAFIYLPAALITGAIFLITFIINNWISIFK